MLTLAFSSIIQPHCEVSISADWINLRCPSLCSAFNLVWKQQRFLYSQENMNVDLRIAVFGKSIPVYFEHSVLPDSVEATRGKWGVWRDNGASCQEIQNTSLCLCSLSVHLFVTCQRCWQLIFLRLTLMLLSQDSYGNLHPSEAAHHVSAHPF